jgi:hypothetical protein
MNIGILCSTLAIGQAPALPPLPLIPAAPAPIVRTVPAAQMPTAPIMKVQAPAPAPMPATPMPATPMTTPAPEEKTAVAEEEKKEEAKPEEDKFFLQKLLESTPRGKQMAEDGWKIYGWTQGSYNASTATTTNSPVPFIQRANQFSMNQSWLHVEKAVDTSKKELQLGFAFDGLYGTDYYTTLSRNLFTGQLTRLTNANPYGWDIFQAYADVFLPNLGGSGTTLRLGKFATFLEYEVVQGISNPFISRSYLFEYNPFTHTGALAITPLGDNWTIQNGAVLGADNWFDPTTNSFTYIGNIKWAPKDGKSWAQFGTMVSSAQFNQAQNFNNYDVFNFQFSHKITDKLTYLLDSSFSFMQNVPNVGTANWYGMVNYLFYQVTDKLTSNFRVDLFEDTNGIRTGYNGLYSAVTYGLIYKPMPWLSIMPEVRYDYNAGNGINTVDGTTQGPWDGKKDLFTFAIGAIVRW